MESTTLNNHHVLIEDGDVEVKLKTEDVNNKKYYEQQPEEEQFILGYDPDVELHPEGEDEEESNGDGELNEYEDPLALPESNTVTTTLGKSHNRNTSAETSQTKSRQGHYRKVINSRLFYPPKNKNEKNKNNISPPSKRKSSSTYLFDFSQDEEQTSVPIPPPMPILKTVEEKKKVYTKVGSHQCLFCFNSFHSYYRCKQHLKHHAGPPPHFCPCCPSRSPSSFPVWFQHVTGAHSDRLKDLTLPKIPLPLVCCLGTCYQRFQTKLELKEHTESAHKKKFNEIHKCPHPGCDMEFKRSKHFLAHKQKSHKPKPAIFFACPDPDCSMKFENGLKRDNHWRDTHRLTFVCPHADCSLKYKDQEDLDNHLRAHLLPPPVPAWTVTCVRCCPATLFPSETALKEHFELKHDFSCPFAGQIQSEETTSKKCPPSFRSALLRNLHMLEVHDCPIESSEYPTLSAASAFLRCNHQGCSVQFKTYRDLMTHIKEKKHKEHTYKCPAYSCTFTTTKYLQFVLHFKHRPHHDPCNSDFTPGENPWTCPVCLDTKMCRSHPSLQRHALTEHKFRTFPCPFVYSDGHYENSNSENKDGDNNKDDVKPLRCGMFFSTFAKLSYHWRFYSEHESHDPKLYFEWLNYAVPFTCTEPDCTEEFLCQSELEKHLKSHPPPPKPPSKYHYPHRKMSEYVDTITKEIVNLPPRRRLGPKRKWDYEDIVKTSGNNSKESVEERKGGNSTESEDENEDENESVDQVQDDEEPQDFMFQMERGEINEQEDEESQEIKSEIKFESEGVQNF